MHDKRVHGGITLGPMVQDPKLSKLEKMKEVVTAEDMSVDIKKMGTEAPAGRTWASWEQYAAPNANVAVAEGGVPEGRVHGGSLLAMLASSSGIGSSNSKGVASEPSEPSSSFMMPRSWI